MELSGVLVFLTALLFVLSPEGAAALSGKDLLKVTFLDVRQGDCTVIQTPDNKVIIIDGGQTKAYRSPFDAGEEVVLPFLKSSGIKKIDMIVATHPDFDHIGGLLPVLNSGIPVGMILDTGIPHTTQTYNAFLQAAKNKKIPVKIPEKGEILNWGDRLRAQVLAPQSPVSQRLNLDLNNNSIVIRLEYGQISFLFTGDCEHAEEDIVLGSGARVKSTILKAAHHGSATGSGPLFYYAVNPEAVVISAGKRNKFDHPNWESVKLFRETGAAVYRTDYSSTITITTDGQTYEIQTGWWKAEEVAEEPPGGAK